MLRGPLSRVVADWLHCENEYLREGSLSHGETLCSHGAKAPPAGTRLMSNESFAWFVNQHADGPSSEHEGWDNGFRTSNLQVGMLASVPKGQPVTREHLKKAKRILGAEKGPVRWVVGTTDTMHEFYLEMAARAGRRATGADATEATISIGDPLAELKLVDTFRAVSMNQLDSELYEWVLQRQATETKLLQDNPPPGVLMVDDGGLDQGTAPAAAAGAGADGASDAAEAKDAAAAPSVPFHYGVERVRGFSVRVRVRV